MLTTVSNVVLTEQELLFYRYLKAKDESTFSSVIHNPEITGAPTTGWDLIFGVLPKR